MTLSTFPDVPRGVLAQLLDLTGKAGGMSPRRLMGEPTPIDPYQIAQLFGGNYLSDTRIAADALTAEFTYATVVVLKPSTNLTFRIWGEDDICGETNILFPGDIGAGGGVLLTPVEQHYRIAAFVEPKDILAILGPMLPRNEKLLAAPFDFEAHFEAAVAAVLFALIDLERGRGIGNWDAGVTAHAISGYLDGRWCLTGFDDLLTYVQSAGMQSRPPAIYEVAYALEVLVTAKSVRLVAPDRYALAHELSPLVDLTRGSLAGFQWQRLSKLETGEILIVDQTYVYGNEGLILRLSPTINAKIHIAAVPASEVVEFIIDEMAGQVGRPDADAAVETTSGVERDLRRGYSAKSEPEPQLRPKRQATDTPATKHCAKCGAEMAEDQAFCVECGVPRDMPQKAEEMNVCPACGATSKPGAKFCARCGTKLADRMESKKPEPVCPSCGQKIKPHTKFCSKCGTKLNPY